MVAVGLTFLVEVLDTSLRTPEDVERHVGLPVLGVIPLIDPVRGGVHPAPQNAAATGMIRRRRSGSRRPAPAMSTSGGEEL